MGMIDNVMSLMRKGPEAAAQLDSLKFINHSVARGANDATFQFPVLISNTIPIDMASAITRTMEKTYVAFTRTWLSLNPTIDITMDRNILQYLKRFHQNVSVESALENLLVDENKVKEYLEKANDDDYYFVTNRSKTFGVLFNKADKATAAMFESHQDYIRESMSDFDLNDFPYVGMKPDMVTESGIGDGKKFRELVKKIKKEKPDSFSDNDDIKRFVDKNYSDLIELSEFTEKDIEKLKKNNVRSAIVVLIGVVAFIVSLPAAPAVGTAVGASAGAMVGGVGFASYFIGIICSVVMSIISYIKAENDDQILSDLKKIRESLIKADIKKFKTEDQKKIKKIISSIDDALNNGTDRVKVTNESVDDWDIYTEAPGDEAEPTSADLVRAAIAGQRREQQLMQQDRMVRQTKELKAPQLADSEAKKANDMMPYALQVRLMAVNDKNEFVQFMDFVLGVKAIMHPLSSDDMIENIQRVMRNQSPMFKFLRWTTGEISLVKNLILNLDDIKADVLNRESGKSPWFSKLKRIKDRKIGIQNFTSPYMLVPNSTMVISSYEAEYLKNHYAIDLTDPKLAKKLVRSLFLMAFVIVDDGNGVIDILYDGSGDFQTYSLETLEREVSLNSNKLGREIGRMISR